MRNSDFIRERVSSLLSVSKALKVLEAFTSDRPELGSTEIANILQLNKSTVSRIVTTLMSHGYLGKSPVNNKYYLGWKLVDLCHRVLSRHDLYDISDHAAPFMEKLAAEIGEIVHLAILDKRHIVTLKKKGGGQTLTVDTKVGGRTPANCSALGRVLLAWLSQKELMNLLALGPLETCTPNTIDDESTLLKELEQIRKQGFAFDDEESFLGIRCVAAPIRDDTGKAIAAISATVPRQRMGEERIEEISKHVIETARLISEGMYMIP